MPVTMGAGRLPCDDLRCHFLLRVAIVSRKAKVSEFELAIRSDKQIVGFEILKPALRYPGLGGPWDRLTR